MLLLLRLSSPSRLGLRRTECRLDAEWRIGACIIHVCAEHGSGRLKGRFDLWIPAQTRQHALHRIFAGYFTNWPAGSLGLLAVNMQQVFSQREYWRLLR